MEQLILWLVFCTAFLALSLWKPGAARIFLGVFFILMAVAVNLVLSFVAPEVFLSLGTDDPLVPSYVWVFHNVVALSPQGVGALAAAGELTVGMLILGRGRSVKIGLALAIAFLLLITPVGIWTLPNPVMAAGAAWLMTRDFPQSPLQMLRARRGRAHTHVRAGTNAALSLATTFPTPAL
ncbi:MULTISPECIES: hypothetical protein [unclassified Arthrobacter]|uniref:hypothetical protein n=1 Tax=unclassified Arthrobacter TaxID=235627 RepID=UPI002DF8D4BB|nr:MULTISPECIES: hypothetical protein [unclassified Arthrobacter]MEC5191014.1 hypothetical protein [Arthrobacter sp. MP_M4]MEC5202185.1 hypothetical protein [Arthrobacter sp. MP_M7]